MNISPRLFVATQTLYSYILTAQHNASLRDLAGRPNEIAVPIEWNKELAYKAYDMAGWLLEIEKEQEASEAQRPPQDYSIIKQHKDKCLVEASSAINLEALQNLRKVPAGAENA